MELVESFKASDISKAILDVGNALLGLTNTDLGNTILQITLLTAAVTAPAAAYAEMGADFSNCTTDEEYLAAIEDFELHPPGANQPSIEERTAAALEAQVLMAMPEGTVSTMSVKAAKVSAVATAAPVESAAFQRIQRNYQKGLWSAALVNMAASREQITSDGATAILNI